MQMYLADCVFPEIEGQLAAYKSFCELRDSGEIAKLDNFDGFEMLFRVHAPGAGRVTILFKAESDAQIFEAFAPWRAQFGIEMDFTPVIRCQDVVGYDKSFSRRCPEQCVGKAVLESRTGEQCADHTTVLSSSNDH